jgi:WD40 repeat protein
MEILKSGEGVNGDIAMQNEYPPVDSDGLHLTNRIPLASNGLSINVINEHHGEIFFAKWNPNKNFLATGGAGDCYVDVWDYGLINSRVQGSGNSTAPWM